MVLYEYVPERDKIIMNKSKKIILALSGLLLLSLIIILVIGALKPKIAGIYVNSNPTGTVFINGKEVGVTPYRSTVNPGDSVVKIVPGSANNLSPYETKINLIAGVETVLNVGLGQNDNELSYDTISFEKIAKGETSLVVVSIPESAQLIIDGRERAFTPHKTSNITAGNHHLLLSSKGYEDRDIDVKTHDGYKLTAVVKLAKSIDGITDTSPSPTPTTVEEQKEQIEILPTGTGFLRVRNEPSTLGNEVGRVEPGKRYNLAERDVTTGWYKIEYEEGSFGWISNQYGKVVEAEKLTPTPAKTQSATSSATPTQPTSLPN